MSQAIDTCVCVIQARRGSSRLPDKVSRKLSHRSVLEWVIIKCLAINGVGKVICAIPDTTENDSLGVLAETSGAIVVRGSEDDVLARYAKAAKEVPSKYVMRVTADCPLIDPEVCSGLLEGVISSQADYGVTVFWPHGLDCEIVKTDVLMTADAEATNKLDREHVTLWVKRQEKLKKYYHSASQDYAGKYRWTLDYPEDWKVLETIAEHFQSRLATAGWREILEFVNQQAWISEYNRLRVSDWAEKTAKIVQDAKG